MLNKYLSYPFIFLFKALYDLSSVILSPNIPSFALSDSATSTSLLLFMYARHNPNSGSLPLLYVQIPMCLLFSQSIQITVSQRGISEQPN